MKPILFLSPFLCALALVSCDSTKPAPQQNQFGYTAAPLGGPGAAPVAPAPPAPLDAGGAPTPATTATADGAPPAPPSPTEAPAAATYNGTPVTHTVAKGDSLWKIGRQYKVPVDVIKKANNLTSDNIQLGKTLTIPQP